MGKLIVLTGLDGTGITSVAEYLCRTDDRSIIVKTPDYPFLDCRGNIDKLVRNASPAAHYLFYLASVVYASSQIEDLLKDGNVYCVRYLIDTVVSHRVAGLPVELVYETEIYRIRRPDLTVFLSVREDVRQQRLGIRGKGLLDKVLDEDVIRLRFLSEFQRLHGEFIAVDTTEEGIPEVACRIRELACWTATNARYASITI